MLEISYFQIYTKYNIIKNTYGYQSSAHNFGTLRKLKKSPPPSTPFKVLVTPLKISVTNAIRDYFIVIFIIQPCLDSPVCTFVHIP